ncbi:MAG: hypothetical protein KatS3mg108_0804 [Isosphaeraceae bacterium]|jgi:hypothetical protein|nr:MAG: hypothetical protein KatS3mg108_0804 [Isosphaeraceae bacterium]
MDRARRRTPFNPTLRLVPPLLVVAALALVLAPGQGIPRLVHAQQGSRPAGRPSLGEPTLLAQSAELAAAKSAGCVVCHQNQTDPHGKPEVVRLGCVDCHGGDPTATDKHRAHVRPRFPEAWASAANPVRSYTLLNYESPEFVRFVNPGDLRVADLSCGTAGCHGEMVLQVRKSMMTHGAMLWGAALYNNGAVPHKWPRYGESYSPQGAPQRLQTVPPPTPEETARKGVLPFLDPLPRFEISQPGNVLRVFERGGREPQEVGLPNPFEDPGRPKARLSARGLGTRNRTDPVFVGLQKTRLLDPTLNFLGTNDHPGDYRSSGCTACHVIYANDRSAVHSGPYAVYGHRGLSFQPDPMIRRDEPGHPIAHRFTSGIPTSQCIVCHIHPGTTVLNSYTGFMWWDEETDGELMYPAEQKNPTAEEFAASMLSNPDEAAARGNWSDPAFLERVAELNDRTRHTQFADYHGHGWVFRAVFKKDRHGVLLDHRGEEVADDSNPQLRAAMQVPLQVKERYRTTAEAYKAAASDPHEAFRDGLPVHQLDVHLERGMHCVDCHFIQDVHGNTKLYGEVRAAIEIQCADCHGTTTRRATLVTSGPASDTSAAQSGKGGRDLSALRTPFGQRRFERQGDAIIQRSMVERDLAWEITQVADTVNPASRHYNERSALAKTIRFEGGQLVWGEVPDGDESVCAHADERMSCIACHSSWNPSCFGCHLPQRANKKMPQLHNEGDVTRNYTSYNFQTLRDDVFMLAHDGDVTGNKINPSRSSCAIHVGSYNANRESIYVQQQTISAEGLSGIAFSTNVPHTVRPAPPLHRDGPDKGRPISPASLLPGRSETKSCTDCHLARDGDNNAILAQLLMLGTNFTNFIGRYCWVAAGDHGLAAVVVTERDEPQAVIGSSLHAIAYPDHYREHLERRGELEHAHEHPGRDISERHLRPKVLSLQARGEFLYAACGEAGLRVFDIAFIDHKGFSERIVTAPVSPLGQRLFVRTSYATAVAAPTTIAPDPTRVGRPENREQPIHPLYAYIYVTDRDEGLILVGAGTLLDGNPLNNFLTREVTFNPAGILRGARSIAIIGTYAYVGCDAGLVVVDIDDPTQPRITSIVGEPLLRGVRSITNQFRYGFVCDADGVKVLDITDLAHPRVVAGVPLADARSIYVARTYAYVAAGEEGLVILDVERPEQPVIDQVYNPNGCLSDANDVKLGITYVSQFAYVAAGRNGLRVVQLTSPDTPGNAGFSPRPTPRLIASFAIPNQGHALAISEGVDRDRAVDESGNQIAVFGRVGARPLSLEEQRRMILHDGRPWFVSDDPRDPIYVRRTSRTDPLAGAAVRDPETRSAQHP